MTENEKMIMLLSQEKSFAIRLNIPVNNREKVLNKALSYLTYREIRALYLRYVENRKFVEIGELIGIKSQESGRQTVLKAEFKLAKIASWLAKSTDLTCLLDLGITFDEAHWLSFENIITLDQAVNFVRSKRIPAKLIAKMKIGLLKLRGSLMVEPPGPNQPIEALEFTNRTHNMLCQYNIKTIRNLTQRSEANILQLDNVGQKTLDEIKSALAKYNLSLSDW